MQKSPRIDRTQEAPATPLAEKAALPPGDSDHASQPYQVGPGAGTARRSRPPLDDGGHRRPGRDRGPAHPGRDPRDALGGPPRASAGDARGEDRAPHGAPGRSAAAPTDSADALSPGRHE